MEASLEYRTRPAASKRAWPCIYRPSRRASGVLSPPRAKRTGSGFGWVMGAFTGVRTQTSIARALWTKPLEGGLPMPAGRHFLQIPGPTNVPDRVLRAIDAPTIDHRG